MDPNLVLIITLKILLCHSVLNYGTPLPQKKCIITMGLYRAIHIVAGLEGRHGIMSFPQTGMGLNVSLLGLEFRTVIQHLQRHTLLAIHIVFALRLGPAGIINI
jgi:hypothetical protein